MTPACRAERSDHIVTLDGGRGYLVHLPPGGPTPSSRVVMILDGATISAKFMAWRLCLSPVSDRHRAIEVYPSARVFTVPTIRFRGDWWDVPPCSLGHGDDCASIPQLQHAPGDDTSFLNDVISDVDRRFHLDPKPVYLLGVSLGANMAYKLACTNGIRLAAVAAISGALTVSDCRPSRPISVLALSARDDRIVPINGNQYFRPASDTLERWRAIDGCGAGRASAGAGYTRTDFAPCHGDAALTWVVVAQGGHGWAETSAVNWRQMVWDFFTQDSG